MDGSFYNPQNQLAQMAMSKQDYEREVMRQKTYQAMVQNANCISGLLVPKPNPEPNKILLLLEDI